MQCPKCQADMEVVNYEGVDIDRCSNCFGLFFDHMEKEDLKKLRGAESIDIGDEFMGARYNEVRDITCPRCDVAMDQVRREEPFEIRFESCPRCKGAYFDAGEFRDYLEEEIFESFQDVLDEL